MHRRILLLDSPLHGVKMQIDSVSFARNEAIVCWGIVTERGAFQGVYIFQLSRIVTTI